MSQYAKTARAAMADLDLVLDAHPGTSETNRAARVTAWHDYARRMRGVLDCALGVPA